MKKFSVWFFVSICLVVAFLAYLSYPLVTGIVERRRLESVEEISDSAEKLPEGELVIIMSADMATKLINASAEEIPLEDLSVAFGDGVIVLSGVTSRDLLMPEDLIAKYPNLMIIKNFIPEYAELGVCFTATVENGELKITPETFTLQDYQLPLGFLPMEIRDAVGDMITGEYLPEGFVLKSVEVTEGKLAIAVD